MVLQNSSNQQFSNGSDGFSLGGGIGTVRTFGLSGADLSILLSSPISGNLLQYNGTNWINVPSSTFGTGSVTNIATGTGLTGGPITNTGTISMGTSGVTAGTYGAGTSFPSITVDALGRITAATTVALGSIASQNANNVSITGGNINGAVVTGLSSPVNTSDAATKGYVDGIASGLDAKQAVTVSSTANIDLTTGGLLTVDGITVTAGDRVLVQNQTAPAENGIYIVGTGSWTRSSDMDVSSEVPSAYVFVTQGNTLAGHGYVVTGFTPSNILGTDPIEWTQFSQAGSYVAGNGLSLNNAFPATFNLNYGNLTAGTFTLGSSNTIAVSDGVSTVSTTLGSLSAFIAGQSISGTDVITVTAGTVKLNYDGEFTNTNGTLGLGAITPSSINSAGTITGLNISGTNTGDQTITLSGDISGSGTGAIAVTLATVNANVGTYNGITINAKGLVTSATPIVVTGDVTGTANGASIALSLGASGVTAGTYGDDLHPAIITVDSKGIVTSASTGTTTLGTGSVTSISTGTYLVGGPITNNGTISHGTSGVTAGTYGLVTVDAYGHVISGTSNNLPWVDVTTTTQQLVPNVGYMTDNSSTVTLTLPTSANFGDMIPVVGFGPGNWILSQNPGQTIYFGIHTSTTGTAGSLNSTHPSDTVEIFCKSSNDFIIRNSVGNLNII